jgi:hypothetical protein
MADDYIELFLKLSSEANQDLVRGWLEKHHLSSTKMKLGLLVLATKTNIEKAFSVSLEDVQLPVELPVPSELQGHVVSVTFPKPRSYHN